MATRVSPAVKRNIAVHFYAEMDCKLTTGDRVDFKGITIGHHKWIDIQYKKGKYCIKVKFISKPGAEQSPVWPLLSTRKGIIIEKGAADDH